MRILALGDRDEGSLTHREVDAALALFGGAWTPTDSPEAQRPHEADGVWLLPGTPYRDDGAAYGAIRHCLTSGTPFLGTCGGFQYACVELARSRGGIADAAHRESDPHAAVCVVERLSCSLYGEERTVHPVAGTRLAAVCGEQPFAGFHWCGFGVADRYVGALERAGVRVSARGEDVGAEAIEVPGHPFFVATAFQPQVGVSRSGRLPALIEAFLAACEAGGDPSYA